MPLNNTIDYIISTNSEFSGRIVGEYLVQLIAIGLLISAVIFAAAYKYKYYLLIPRNNGESVQDSIYLMMLISLVLAVITVIVVLNIATVATVALILLIPISLGYCMFSAIMYMIDGGRAVRGE